MDTQVASASADSMGFRGPPVDMRWHGMTYPHVDIRKLELSPLLQYSAWPHKVVHETLHIHYGRMDNCHLAERIKFIFSRFAAVGLLCNLALQ